MSQIIVGLLCLAGLALTAYIAARGQRDHAPSQPPARRSDIPERDSRPVPTPARQPAIHYSERQIAQAARQLTEEVEQYLADHWR
jgi:hypothetical protein